MPEIESYSDRLKPPAPSGPSKLDPAQLHLDESLFPPVLWKEYFEGQAVSEKKGKARKRRKLDSDDEGEKGEEMVSPFPERCRERSSGSRAVKRQELTSVV
jgi:hypothetical protein